MGSHRARLGALVVTGLLLGASGVHADTRDDAAPGPGSSWGPLQFPVAAAPRPAKARIPGPAPAPVSIARPQAAKASGTPLGQRPAFSPLVGSASRPVPPRRAASPKPAKRAQPAKRPRKAPQICHIDKECPEGTICERGECVKLRRPINIAYLFYRSASRRYTSVLGLYHHRWGKEGFRVVAPFYFHFWDRRRSTRVVVPFWVSTHDRKTHRSHQVFLMFHRFKGPKSSEFNIWPLLFTTSYGKRGYAFTVMPLFHYGREGKRWSVYSLLPIPWYAYKSPTKTRFFALPFTGGVLTKKSSFVWTLPLNFYWRRGARKHSLFLPLYYGLSDAKKKQHKSVLFPLYYYSRQGNRRVRFLSLLASYSRDRQAHRRTFVWHLPPLVFYRDRERSVNVAFPLYFGYQNRSRGSSLHVVPPFVYYRDRRQRNAALLPLFYYFKDVRTGAYTTLLFPLFYRHRAVHNDDRLTIVGPWYLRQNKSGWHSGLFPIFWVGSGKRTSHTVLFPLFWHRHNKIKKTTFTLFGNVYATTGPHRWSFGIVPFLFAGRSAHGHHAVVFPLFWHQVDRARRRAFTVAGPAFWWRRGDDHGHGVFPLYWFQRWYTRGFVSSATLVFPFLFHLNTPRQRLLITPLGGFAEDRVRRRRTGVVLSAFWRTTPTSRTVGVLPFYVYHRDDRTRSRTHFFLPINIYRKTPTSSSLVLFPLLWKFRSPKESSLVVFPLYWRLRQKKGWNADVLFPLFWKLRKGRRRVLAIGPVYHERGGDVEHTRRFGIFPLLHVGWDRRITYGHFLPLVFHYRNKAKGTGFTVAGPFYSVLNRKSRHSGVLPLVYWGHTGPKSYAVGFPLVWHFANAAKQSSTTFVGPIFWHRRGEVRGGGLAPLLWVQHSRRRTQVTLFPLLHVERRPNRMRFWTPLFGFGWDRALNSHHGYVGPVYWDRTGTTNTQVVFPLFWRFASQTAKTASIVAFPFYFGRIRPEERFDVVFPLVWHRKTVTSRTLFVAPLFYDHHVRYESRTTTLFPFFFRRRVYYEDDTLWMFPPSIYVRNRPGKLDAVVFPLFWHFKRPNYRTTVLFPIYWDFKRPGGKRSVVGFPIYWDFQRPGRRSTVVFPFVWRFRKKDEVRTVVLNSYYYENRKKKTWQYLFLPLFEVARKRPGDFKFSFLGGLVGYERIGRNRRLKLFFVPIKLKPAPGIGPTAAPRPRARSQTFYPL